MPKKNLKVKNVAEKTLPKSKECHLGKVLNPKTGRRIKTKKNIKKKKDTQNNNSVQNNQPENKYDRMMRELGSMVDSKFSKIRKKDANVQMIFWFDADTNNNSPFIFSDDFPIKKSRDIKEGFTSDEKKSVINFFSKNEKMSSNGENDLPHPKELLSKIVGLYTPLKIKKTEVELKYLFPNELYYDPLCNGRTKKWKCVFPTPVLCALVRYKFALTKEILKENIAKGTLRWSLMDDLYQEVYQGPESEEWKNSKLMINKREWIQKLIDNDQGDYDGTYTWEEGAFKFGLNNDCFSIM